MHPVSTALPFFPGSVTVSRDDVFTGERYERTYFTGKSEGFSYVYFTINGKTSQVCDRMGSTGSTLMTTRDNLIETIRRELKKQNDDERKILA